VKCNTCDVMFSYKKHKKFCDRCKQQRQSEACNKCRKKPESKVRRNSQLKERRKKEPWIQLRVNISCSINRALKRRHATKNASVKDFLPYSMPQLKAHLESFFSNKNGFTWENHGKIWHVDHIIPHSYFHYTTMDCKAFRDCWALTNLVPMRNKENNQKGNSRIGFFDECGQGRFLA